ncbi:hypothetical protein MMC31_003499 [Peltigera leucophlebia]|nr:hypothetical protein [Peltigera leucophlebia]
MSKEIAGEAVVVKVNGTLWDVSRPLEEDGHCKISYLSIKDPEGRVVFWHSAAHLLGEAAEHEYGCMLLHGPPPATGFFYDIALGSGHKVKKSDWPALEALLPAVRKLLQPTIDANAPAENKDKGLFALKPMNCPGQYLTFTSEERSYPCGALSGLTQVCKFQQDDGYIFYPVDQVTSKLEGMFDFMTYVYALFGFPFKLKLFTRPDSYMGKLENWDRAEEQLKQALQAFQGDNWVLNSAMGHSMDQKCYGKRSPLYYNLTRFPTASKLQPSVPSKRNRS